MCVGTMVSLKLSIIVGRLQMYDLLVTSIIRYIDRELMLGFGQEENSVSTRTVQDTA